MENNLKTKNYVLLNDSIEYNTSDDIIYAAINEEEPDEFFKCAEECNDNLCPAKTCTAALLSELSLLLEVCKDDKYRKVLSLVIGRPEIYSLRKLSEMTNIPYPTVRFILVKTAKDCPSIGMLLRWRANSWFKGNNK